ncbi:MBOAT family O-acyltransferase [Brumimicrobium aurantiacum]|uniref:MBOAT family protein n=1 Tax=Brumimicrobium aurantiacum TaxID=1737063 RepID=A0A3E1F0A7_9FLAO|nr:MBOAT family O-acyltransferase [Brumimicrobium aurantiacum]RFC55259.1 MBOAT family protein [Brumimicrobium aurantiacum]
MLFNSIVFLFAFLPILLTLYYLTPKKYRNYTILLFSFIFYAWGGVSYTFILIGSILINYLFVKQIEKNNALKKTWLIIGLTVNVLIIVLFKYLDFLIDNFNILGAVFISDFSPVPFKNIVLPLGISFFTFQQMSLLWDVYRNENTEKTSLSNIALYISLFPQLIAGPIVRYNDIVGQIKHRVSSISLFRSGIQRFVLGLFKKVVIANTCGELADSIFNSSYDSLDSPTAWLGIVAYSLQIYFDFSGYSDMAIGLGRMFGFKILENFNFPYISKSIQEFWRRWHISLSTWFRDYVYIPMGGNRNGSYKTYFNLITVFFLTGIWHGATWSFVIWGLFHGFFLIIERIGFKNILHKLPKGVQWFYTIIVVMIGWVLFRVEIFSDALLYIKKLFSFNLSSEFSFLNYLNNERILVLILAIISSSLFFMKIKEILERRSLLLTKTVQTFMDLGVVLLLIISIIYINSGSYSPFIYFRF